MGRLRSSLAQSRKAMAQQLAVTVFDPADTGVWERIEEGLIAADVGVTTTVAIVERLEGEAAAGRLVSGSSLAQALRTIGSELMHREAPATIDVSHQPTVVMLVGVNGTGKTTTVGKLAARLAEHGKRVTVAAADTFRAAATEQLEVWAQRANAQFVKSAKEGGDPASVAYDAVSGARDGHADVVLVDTAGRLHTKTNLMHELTKIGGVVSQLIPGAPHMTLLTIDATTGQNGMRQAREFSQAVHVDGIVLTKLDGSAKGGIALAIAHELDIPIVLVGVGESLEDLQPFDSESFLEALFPDDLLAAG
jgi:fused signal recognition particle receptor